MQYPRVDRSPAEACGVGSGGLSRVLPGERADERLQVTEEEADPGFLPAKPGADDHPRSTTFNHQLRLTPESVEASTHQPNSPA